MNTKTKSVLIILGTLLVGIIIGGLATSTIFTQRVDAIQALRRQGGLVQFLENVIEPVDQAQREQIQSIVKKANQQQFELRQSMFEENRQVLSEMWEELDDVLTVEQKTRFRQWFQRERRDGPGFMPPDVLRGRRRMLDGKPRFPRDSLQHRRRFERPPFERRIPSDSTQAIPDI